MKNITEYICFIGDKAKAIKKIDEDICKIIESMDPTEIHIPSIIDKDILKKIGYFKSFPHQIMGINSLADSKKYSNFVLTPSACLHFYPIFGELSTKKGVFTTKARVYRNEDEKCTDGKIRLIDFTVREIVVVGTKSEVHEVLDKIAHKILCYADKLGLNIELKTAFDPFYPNKENLIKKKLQIGNNQKKEMIVLCDNDEVSIGSINYHGFHFSKAFNFDDNNNIVTGCIGIGLERWIHSLINNDLIYKALNYDFGEEYEK